MACNCCTCVSCKRHREKQKLVTSMPVEIRNQTQGATADWFLDRLVELQLSQEDEEKLKNGGFISLFGKDLVIDGFRQQEAVTDQLEKEYQISTENYDKDLYETKVD